MALVFKDPSWPPNLAWSDCTRDRRPPNTCMNTTHCTWRWGWGREAAPEAVTMQATQVVKQQGVLGSENEREGARQERVTRSHTWAIVETRSSLSSTKGCSFRSSTAMPSAAMRANTN